MRDDVVIGERDLSFEATAALATVVDANVDSVAGALAAEPPPGAVFGVCLYYSVDEDELLYPVALYVGLDAERARVLANKPIAKAFEEVWNPMTYTGGELEPDPRARDTPGFAEAEAVLAGELGRLGVEDRARWVLDRVARRLSAMDLAIERTPDFVVFPVDPQFGEALLDSIRFSAPPQAAAALEASGLLPESFDALARMYRETR